MEEFILNLQLPAFQQKKRKLEGLKLHEVLYLQAESNYTVFYFRNGQKLMTSFSLGNYSKLEGLHFIRANRSFIINTSFIKKVDFEQNYLELHNGLSIVISRRRKGIFMTRYQKSGTAMIL